MPDPIRGGWLPAWPTRAEAQAFADELAELAGIRGCEGEVVRGVTWRYDGRRIRRRATVDANAIEIQGTLRADGTLELDEKPSLPPGRVKVRVELAQPAAVEANDVISVLARIHAEQAARGYAPRSAEEVEADIAEMREDDERTEMIERIQEEGRRQRAAGRREGG